ncbi:MAG: hypothetical protein LBC73_10435, partial [Oscillospiraceae bacterium]|nr:hypothetical protein [Oscillospiraceae bacterium]
MKTRFEKTMRITSDLMMYCHHNGARELNTNIIEADDRINYVVNAYPVELSTEMLDGMILRL